MINFSKLHFDLASLPERNRRMDRLFAYFQNTDNELDRHWAQQLLQNTALKRYIQYDKLRVCTAEYTGLPLWLIEESIGHVGNVSEAITLLVKNDNPGQSVALHKIMQAIHNSENNDIQNKIRFIQSMWDSLPHHSLYIFNKLITGSYRSPVSRPEVEQSIEKQTNPPHSYYTMQAVLLYVSRNEYTFAVWKGDLLMPVVKTYAGITADERMKIRKYVSRNTREQFGPVVSVNPGLVYEIAFVSIEKANRRKSGIKLISPRIVRCCEQASLDEVDHLDTLYTLFEDLNQI